MTLTLYLFLCIAASALGVLVADHLIQQHKAKPAHF
jgi:cell division protein FtsL